jgi:hypothetical protein
MKHSHSSAARQRLSTLMAACLIALPMAAHSEEREDLEKLRATVLGLIDTLVKNGVIGRTQVDAMMRDAQRRAEARLAEAPPPEVGADGKKVVRVPYVPESLRAQVREQVRAELAAQSGAAVGVSVGAMGAPSSGRVLAAAPSGPQGPAPQALAVPVAGSAALTETASRVQIEGDFRLRAEVLRPGSDNTAASAISIGNPDFTRAADLWSNPTANTQEHQDRSRVRARLGVNVAVAEGVTTGVSLTTGSTTGPTSTNQTMAQGAGGTAGYFNKYGVVLDRAFVRYEPASWLGLSGGRFRNPFLGTDLVWADDLNFEGFAAALKAPAGALMDSFVTVGWFPLSYAVPNQSPRRSLLAAQAGVNWQFGLKDNRLKLGVALYDYTGIEGIKETTTDKTSVPGYAVRSEYGAGYRQRGNTLFRVNTNPSFDTATNWGLASSFRELDVTAVLDVAQFDPLHVVLTADVVRNLGFNRGAMQRRVGSDGNLGGDALGYLGKIQVGAPAMRQQGDWNVSLAYRRLGSDAVLDAFTNSDFGLGGTNNKGFVLGGNYGLSRNSWMSLRWMSSDLIESMVPAAASSSARTKYSLDTLQVDLNVRY